MKEMIDLSLSLENGMITYPSSSHVRFESSVVGRIAVEGRETRKFTMGSHCGTHIDSMRHFFADGKTIDQLSLNALVGEATIIDFGILEPKTVISVEDIKPLLKKKKYDRIVLKTGWDRFWNTAQYYSDWPTLTEECAELIIDLGIKLIGFDFPSPDPPHNGNECSVDCPNHKKFFQNNIILVEYLCNLKKLQSNEVFLMVLPLKLLGFDGAPARVCAYSLE